MAKPLVANEDQSDGAISKQHSQSLSDLKHLHQQRNKQVLPLSNSFRKVESTSITNLDEKQPNVFVPEPSTSKQRPKYPLPETSTGSNHYEEPKGSSTKSSFKKVENLGTEKLPPLPKSEPPPLFLQNEYDEPDEHSFTVSSKFDLPNNSTAMASSSTSVTKNSIKLKNGDILDTREVTTINSLYLEGSSGGKKGFFSSTTDEEYEEITPGEEYKVTFPLSDKDLEPSTLILMTQPSVDDSSYTELTQRPYALTNGFPNEQEEDFKVNVVKYDYKRNYSMSEDEMSTGDVITEEPNSYLASGYSSQAASIFFGVDMEPPQARPRKVLIHSTNEDEEDC